MRLIARIFLSAALVAGAALQAEMTPEQVQQLPPAASHKIDFTKEIKPILEISCTKCHGRGKAKGDFRIDDRETFLKGGESGPAVIAGKSDQSKLIELVMGFDPDSIMPAKGSRLKPDQIGLLRAWIDQGVAWDKEVWLGKVEAKNLHPRLPATPASRKFSNPVDGLVDLYFKTNKVKWPETVNDRVFARRVYLDLIGLLPPAGDLEKFVSDRTRDKRGRLVEKLLSQNRDYAEHWLSFWNDMLRNDYKGTGYIDGGRKQITKWLYNSLLTNKPYDQFVAELVNPNSESEGFTKGIIWRGTVNASQIPPMQAAQTVSQVFMGINMKCASCHDSFVSDWQLSDSYGLANIFADETLEISQCDKPTGKTADSKFLYPEFGTIDPKADKPTRLKQLAACVTSPKNGRLSRTFVNRLWGRFMGHALVEPVDDMEQAAWNQDLLDWLAEDFVAHQYDVKHLLTQIVTARAYQLPAVDFRENEARYVFRGPAVRRMTAEQFRDALTAVTGVGYAAPVAPVEAEDIGKKYNAPIPVKWIWNEKNAEDKAKAETVFFRKIINLEATPSDAQVLVTCDNAFRLFINGHKVSEGSDFTRGFLTDIRSHLKAGENVVAVEGVNNLPNNVEPTPDSAVAGTENPAGLMVYARVRARQNGAEKVMDFASDKTWICSNEKREGWEKTGFTADWKKAVELGNATMAPWRLKGDFIASHFAAAHPGKVRAALVTADPLAISLGRPNREQVVTTRPSTATTLQALELTNGETVSQIMSRAAAALAGQIVSPRDVVEKVYEQALGRKPSANELKLAQEVVGKPVRKDGVEDFLWAMTMLPEFQLIY
jgi:hypothetical protein